MTTTTCSYAPAPATSDWMFVMPAKKYRVLAPTSRARDGFQCAYQASLHVQGHRLQIRVAGDGERDNRIQCRDHTASRNIVGVHDDVTRKEQPDVPLRRERSVRERGIARAEDDVGTEVDVELLLHRCHDVNFTENSESLRGQRLFDALDSALIVQRNRQADTVPTRFRNHHSSPTFRRSYKVKPFFEHTTGPGSPRPPCAELGSEGCRGTEILSQCIEHGRTKARVVGIGRR